MQERKGHRPRDGAVLHILRVSRVHDGADVHREAGSHLPVKPVSTSKEVGLVSVTEDHVLLTAVTLDELCVPGDGGATVSRALVTMHCKGVGAHSYRTLHVAHTQLIESEQVLYIESTQTRQWSRVSPHEVLEAKIVVTFKPTDSGLRRSLPEVGQDLLEAVDVLL